MKSTYTKLQVEAYAQAAILSLPAPDFQQSVEPGMPRSRANPSEGMDAVVGIMDASRALAALRRHSEVKFAHLVCWFLNPVDPQVDLGEAYEALRLVELAMNGEQW